MYKHQFRGLSDVLEQIKDRNYKFIIYMDDLSFEEYELEYKYLKAIIEGGLGIKPQNVLIYATSNRRHLIREKFSDKRELDDDLHSNDTVQEKLSLVARFGVMIYYGSPDKKEFQNIVRVLGRQIPHPYAGGRSASGSQQVGVKPRRAVRTYCHPVYCKLTQQAERRDQSNMTVKTFAAIDVGSFELELGIFEISASAGIREIDHVRHALALGKDTYNDGRLSHEIVEEMCEVLNKFREVMKTYRVSDYRAFASSALREARNSQMVLDRILVRTGLRVRTMNNSELRFKEL